MPTESSLFVLALSAAVFCVIVSTNLIGLHAIAVFIRKRPAGSLRHVIFLHEVRFILLVMFSFFLLYFLTNALWAAFMSVTGVLPTYHQCLFYALENYTSLGLTRVQVDDSWRILAPLISLSGVFCLGWSIAVLVSVFGHLYSTGPDSGPTP